MGPGNLVNFANQFKRILSEQRIRAPMSLKYLVSDPKTGDTAAARRRNRVFSRRILCRVGVFSEKSPPSRAEMAAWGAILERQGTAGRPPSGVGYENRNRPRLRGEQTSSAVSTRLASQTLSFSTLQ